MKSAINIQYFDNAATTFPKPPSVVKEVKKCLEVYGGNAGRGAHRLSLSAANKIYECRESLCQLLNLEEPEQIAFVPSCTFGINLIIKGVLHQGDHVLISDMEHNAVWRPIEKLKKEGLITYDIFPALSQRMQSDDNLLAEIEKRIRPNTRLVICTHQSNICSFSLPIEKIGALCKKNHIIFAVDGAQSVGHYDIDVKKMNIDLLAAPSHKGLYGPMGSGFIAISKNIKLDTLIEGGNGIYSLEADMGEISPERYEAGTLPLPAIAGLCEGIKVVKNVGVSYVSEHEKDLFIRLKNGLKSMRELVVYAPEFSGSTLLFNIDNVSSERVSSILNENNICSRAG